MKLLTNNRKQYGPADPDLASLRRCCKRYVLARSGD